MMSALLKVVLFLAAKHLLENVGLDIATHDRRTSTKDLTLQKKEIRSQGPSDPPSNFYPCTLHIFNRTFQSSEAAYQFRKAIHHDNYEKADKIATRKWQLQENNLDMKKVTD